MDMNQRQQMTTSELYKHWLNARVQGRLACAKKEGTEASVALTLVGSVVGHPSLSEEDRDSVAFVHALLSKDQQSAIIFLLNTPGAHDKIAKWPSLQEWKPFAHLCQGVTSFRSLTSGQIWDALAEMNENELSEEEVGNAVVKSVYADYLKVCPRLV